MWRVAIGPCVKLSAPVTQRPTVGGEDIVDNSKQRITMPAKIVATHIPKTTFHEETVQFTFRIAQEP